MRKTFKHSEATKQKIRDTLKKKWAEDSEYQAKMRRGQGTDKLGHSTREKISKSLKEKWQDPKFREKMISSMKSRRSHSIQRSISQREKISESMKKKWQDGDYRKKTILGMEKYRERLPPRERISDNVTSKPKTVQHVNINATVALPMIPMKSSNKKKRVTRNSSISSTSINIKTAKKKLKKKKLKKKKAVKKKKTRTGKDDSKSSTSEQSDGKSENLKDDGDISRMREERRDLYDLLYGDDVEKLEREESCLTNNEKDLNIDPEVQAKIYISGATRFLNDENLDEFDPYNLDDY